MDELLQAFSFPPGPCSLRINGAGSRNPVSGGWPGWSEGLGQGHGEARPSGSAHGPRNLCMQLASLLKCRWGEASESNFFVTL